MARASYKTQTVARLTGFSPALLRMWERRFEFLSPRRTPGRTRIFDADDLRVLASIRDLQAQGRSIGEIALMGRRELVARAPQLDDILGTGRTVVTAPISDEVTRADAVLALDGECRILHASAELERLIGWFPVEVIGTPLAALLGRGAGATRALLGGGDAVARLVGRTLQLPLRHRNRSEVEVEMEFLFQRAAAGGPLLIATLRPVRPAGVAPATPAGDSGGAVRRLVARLELATVYASLIDTLLEDEGAARAELWLRVGRRGLALAASGGVARPAVRLPWFDGVLAAGRATRFDKLARGRTVDRAWRTRHAIAAVVAAPVLTGTAPAGLLIAYARAERVVQASTVAALAGLAATALTGHAAA